MAAIDGACRPCPEEIRRRRLLRACRRGDRGAQTRLVESYLPLVQKIAAQYRGYGLAHDDLLQEGTIGLLDAIDRYDSGRGRSFESYVRFRIRRSIKRALTDQARLIRLPKHIVERRSAIRRAETGLLASGATATPEAIAEATGLSVTVVLEARDAPLASVSLDDAGAAGGAPLAEAVADPGARDPIVHVLADERHRLLERRLAGLSPVQQELVARRWGLAACNPAHASTLAAEIGLSPRRTQTLAREALYALRRDLESDEPEHPPAADR